MEDWICCPRCGGRGLVLLEAAAPEMAQTLTWLRQHGPAAAGAICRGLKTPTTTGMANRLVALLELGLVTREKQGREWVYRAVDFTGPG